MLGKVVRLIVAVNPTNVVIQFPVAVNIDVADTGLLFASKARTVPVCPSNAIQWQPLTEPATEITDPTVALASGEVTVMPHATDGVGIGVGAGAITGAGDGVLITGFIAGLLMLEYMPIAATPMRIPKMMIRMFEKPF